MKKKLKKPKDYLVKMLLDDLKNTSGDSDYSVSIDAPVGMLDPLEKADQDKTTVLGGEELDLSAGQTQDLPIVESKIEVPESSNDETLVLGEVSNSVSASQNAVDSKNKIKNKIEDAPVQEEDANETRVARRPSPNSKATKEEPKVSYGGGRGKYSPFEAQFAQAENLKLAQQRILDLEKSNDHLRRENEVLSSAAEISRQKMDELVAQIHQLDKQRHELRAANESELQIFKEGLAAKESEILRLRAKVDELESRLSKDLRKVRVRERELENRLELSKAEKAALLRAKDEAFLELKRQNENLESEIERYQNRVIELGQKIELNQEQFARTVRALRLALTNLEVSDGTSSSITLAPLKKAE
jgi:DNA repair exonuclease SbcCD ATPase subunit